MSLSIVALRGSVPTQWVMDFRSTLGKYSGFGLGQRRQLLDIFQVGFGVSGWASGEKSWKTIIGYFQHNVLLFGWRWCVGCMVCGFCLLPGCCWSFGTWLQELEQNCVQHFDGLLNL